MLFVSRRNCLKNDSSGKRVAVVQRSLSMLDWGARAMRIAPWLTLEIKK